MQNTTIVNGYFRFHVPSRYELFSRGDYVIFYGCQRFGGPAHESLLGIYLKQCKNSHP